MLGETAQTEDEIVNYFEKEITPSENRKAFRVDIIEEPVEQIYYSGDELNLAGLKARVWYDDLTIEEIDWRDERIVAEGFDSSKEGKCLIKVYFQDENVICVTANRFDARQKFDAVLCVGEINNRRFDPLQCLAARNIDVFLYECEDKIFTFRKKNGSVTFSV